jgi:ribosomal protein S18 acetylase RimI-like enzyme
MQRLQAFFQQDGNRFSYQNAWVAVQQHTVVGMVLGFAGRDEPRLNAAVGGWLVREAHDDEWYVDALAVLQNWNRQGIGARLLRVMERQARQRGYATVALRVADENLQALEFYRHQQYRVTEQTILYQQRYLRMIKVIDHTKDDTSD